MYTAYELTEKSRKVLYIMYRPKYPDFIGHHITEEFGVANDSAPPSTPTLVEVVGYIDDGNGVEGFLVEVDGTSNRPSGGQYHITWSIDRSNGRKPFHTNNIIGDAKKISPVKIDVIPNVFK